MASVIDRRMSRENWWNDTYTVKPNYRGSDKSLVRPGTKQVTATEDFDVHISYL